MKLSSQHQKPLLLLLLLLLFFILVFVLCYHPTSAWRRASSPVEGTGWFFHSHAMVLLPLRMHAGEEGPGLSLSLSLSLLSPNNRHTRGGSSSSVPFFRSRSLQ